MKGDLYVCIISNHLADRPLLTCRPPRIRLLKLRLLDCSFFDRDALLVFLHYYNEINRLGWMLL